MMPFPSLISSADLTAVLAVDRQAQAIVLGIKGVLVICALIAWLYYIIKCRRLKKLTDEELCELALIPASHKELEKILKTLKQRGVSIKFIRPVLVDLLRLGGEYELSAWKCLGVFYPKLRKRIVRKGIRRKIEPESWEMLDRFAQSVEPCRSTTLVASIKHQRD